MHSSPLSRWTYVLVEYKATNSLMQTLLAIMYARVCHRDN